MKELLSLCLHDTIFNWKYLYLFCVLHFGCSYTRQLHFGGLKIFSCFHQSMWTGIDLTMLLSVHKTQEHKGKTLEVDFSSHFHFFNSFFFFCICSLKQTLKCKWVKLSIPSIERQLFVSRCCISCVIIKWKDVSKQVSWAYW